MAARLKLQNASKPPRAKYMAGLLIHPMGEAKNNVAFQLGAPRPTTTDRMYLKRQVDTIYSRPRELVSPSAATFTSAIVAESTPCLASLVLPLAT